MVRHMIISFALNIHSIYNLCELFSVYLSTVFAYCLNKIVLVI